jgi:hypothetical protein
MVPMVEADPVVRSARNGFFVLILSLFGVGMYQIIVLGEDGVLVSTLWLVGVVVFYGSKQYYKRTAPETEGPVDTQGSAGE